MLRLVIDKAVSMLVRGISQFCSVCNTGISCKLMQSDFCGFLLHFIFGQPTFFIHVAIFSSVGAKTEQILSDREFLECIWSGEMSIRYIILTSQNDWDLVWDTRIWLSGFWTDCPKCICGGIWDFEQTVVLGAADAVSLLLSDGGRPNLFRGRLLSPLLVVLFVCAGVFWASLVGASIERTDWRLDDMAPIGVAAPHLRRHRRLAYVQFRLKFKHTNKIIQILHCF